jgi:hypothetical protein
MDIVGGAVGSLCEVMRHATCFDGAGHWVNLLFDQETSHIRVESPYTHSALRVCLKRPGALFVRMPPWVDVRSINIPESNTPPQLSNGYLFLARPPVNRPLTLAFPLASDEIILQHRTRTIRARLRGDEVIAMDNFGADLTFFPAISSD